MEKQSEFKKLLEERGGKSTWKKMAQIVLSTGVSPDEFLAYLEDVNSIKRKNVAQTLSYTIDNNSVYWKGKENLMAHILLTSKFNDVQRNLLRAFEKLDIPEEFEGEVFDFILKRLGEMETPIAVKAFGMTVGRRICEKYPELSGELIPLIEILVQEKVSAGIVNRGQKELKKLHKIYGI